MKIAVILLLFGLSAARSQSVFEGHVEGGDPETLRGMSVQLSGPGPASTDFRADVDLSGSFHLTGLKPGTYILQLMDCYGHQVVSQTVEVSYTPGSVSVVMPNSYRETSSAGTVSVATLQHKPKAAAFKACMRAQKLSDAKDFTHAALELEKAVSLDPLFAAAHGNLGAEYARLLRFSEAEAQLRKAIALDPATGLYHSDLGWVLFEQGHVPEGQAEAQRGVDLDVTNPRSHMLLGYLLALQPQKRASAIPHLVFAAHQIPDAHRVLAAVYRIEGKENLANQEVQLYQAELRDSSGLEKSDQAATAQLK